MPALHLTSEKAIKFIDLFCGIGGFRHAISNAAEQCGLHAHCTFSSDSDKSCQESYQANFGEMPHGDISEIKAHDVPDHDILLAGFPCQPFSIIGQMKGFEDTRGTLFFDIARILDAKKPSGFVLENVKLLAGHDKGRTLSKILATLADLGYTTDYKILNALDFGLPQKRERIWILGTRVGLPIDWPVGNVPMKPLSAILEKTVPARFYASDYIRSKRLSRMTPSSEDTIWHENKSGNISAYPYSCALRAGASYNYLLVNGERRLTPREMLRLQGFPEKHEIVSSDYQARKQAGNSLPVNVAQAVLFSILESLYRNENKQNEVSHNSQLSLLESKEPYNERAKAKKRRKVQTTVSPK